MIVIAGTPSEPPVRLVREAAEAVGTPVLMLDETAAESWHLTTWGDADGVHATVHGPEGEVDLASATGIYVRLTAPRQHGRVIDALESARAAAAVGLLAAWADVAEIRVANRPASMASNLSKPYQASLIRAHGFHVPHTLVSNDPDAVRTFWRRHGRVIFKSTSGVRSIVHELTPERARTLDRVRHLPTQFQQLLEGTNVRVHVIGDDVFPVEITSDNIDYRYREGGEASGMTPTELPDELRQRCLDLSRALDLPLAGIDLFRDDDGQWWCFEVNPSPAYSCFEEPTGLPMSAALARWLAGEAD